MKRAGIVFSLITSLIMLLSPAALAQTFRAGSDSNDDAAIKHVVAQYAKYWNRHEFARTAELRTEETIELSNDEFCLAAAIAWRQLF